MCAPVGMGLARFAYTPLLPALTEGGWFDRSGHLSGRRQSVLGA
jgi:hypothetical protein